GASRGTPRAVTSTGARKSGRSGPGSGNGTAVEGNRSRACAPSSALLPPASLRLPSSAFPPFFGLEERREASHRTFPFAAHLSPLASLSVRVILAGSCELSPVSSLRH